MNREEAIKQLEVYRACMRADGAETDAYDIAIEALEQQPCEDATLKDIFCMGCEYKEQEQSVDAISRQAVIEGLASIAKAKAKSDAQKSMMGRTMFFVEQLPTVSTEKTDAYKKGWHDAIDMALKEAYTIHHYGDIFRVVQEETLIGLGMAYEQPYVPEINDGKMGESEE